MLQFHSELQPKEYRVKVGQKYLLNYHHILEELRGTIVEVVSVLPRKGLAGINTKDFGYGYIPMQYLEPKNLIKEMKGIYLCAYKAHHPNYNLDYNDVMQTSPYINIFADMLTVDLNSYDYVIATPPCNYWSRGNYRRETSEYSQKTKHLLPSILHKLSIISKPFIVENVRNKPLFKKYGLYDLKNVFIYEFGRHTYWSNVKFDLSDIPQVKDNTNYIAPSKRQGGYNVHVVIEKFLSIIHEKK